MNNIFTKTRASKEFFSTIIKDYFYYVIKKNLILVDSPEEFKNDGNLYATGGYSNQRLGNYYTSLLKLFENLLQGGHITDNSFTPLPYSIIKSNFRKLSNTNYFLSGSDLNNGRSGLSVLCDFELLEKVNYDQGMNICYGYKIHPKLSVALMSGIMQYKSRLGDNEQEVRSNHITKDNFLTQNFDNLGTSLNNDLYETFLGKLDKIEVNLKDFKEKYKILLGFKEGLSPIQVLLSIKPPKLKETRRIAEKFLVDYSKLLSVNNPTGSLSGFKYKPRFVLNSTGRMTEVNGIQGICRLSKSILHDKENLYNYDLKSSQINAIVIKLNDLIKQVKLSDEDMKTYQNTIGLLVNYTNKSDAADYYSSRLGISKDDWKSIIYSIAFGSNCESNWSHSKEVLSKYKFADLEFWNELKHTLFAPIFIWNKYVKEYTYLVAKNNKVSNGIMEINLLHDSIRSRTKGKLNKYLSAFWLQGLEVNFIFNLIKLMKNKLVSYEYDGIITVGDIEQEIIDKAKINSGFINAVLVNKSFN